MTVSTVDSACLPRTVVSSRFRLSGVVMSSSGGRRSMRWRSPGSVSPLRVWTRRLGNGMAAAAKRSRRAAMGSVRLARMSLLSAFRGDTYNTRVAPGSDLPVAKESMAQRNAVSVLPLPVGAVTSRCSPAAMRGQLRRCTSVGSPKVVRNQRAISGWKTSSALMRGNANGEGLGSRLEQPGRSPTVTNEPAARHRRSVFAAAGPRWPRPPSARLGRAGRDDATRPARRCG